jgi:hypothetical protein
MAASLKLFPGSTIRWHDRRYSILDYEGLDILIALQPGRRRLERIPVNETQPDHVTMLFLLDGLYGNDNVDGPPHRKWKMAPFSDASMCFPVSFAACCIEGISYLIHLQVQVAHATQQRTVRLVVTVDDALV